MEDLSKTSPTEERHESDSEKPRKRVDEFIRRWLLRRQEPLNFGREQAQEPETTTEVGPKQKSSWDSFREGWHRLFRSTESQPDFLPEKRGMTNVRQETEEMTQSIPEVPTEPFKREATPLTQEAPGSSEKKTTDADEKKEDKREPNNTSVRFPETVSAASSMTDTAERVMAPFTGYEATKMEPKPTVERVVESRRGTAAVAALLGLEYIGRHRADRKLRKRSQKAEKRQDKSEDALHTLEQQNQSTLEHLRVLRAQQLSIESQPNRAEPNKGAETFIPPSAEVKKYTGKIEQAVPTIDRLPLAEQVVQQTEKQQRPEAVLERVEVAAEQGIPVEAIYERRHESKDRFDASGVGGGPSGGNSPILLAEALQKRHATSQAERAYNVNSAEPNKQLTTQPAYKNAVKNGFLAAIVLLIFVAILFLIARS